MSTSRFINSSSIKNTVFTSIFALFLLGFAAAPLAQAQTGEPYSKGSYQFALEDRYVKYVEFEARGRGDGSADGYMTLTDEAPITYQDVDGTSEQREPEEIKGYYIKAQFDSMTVTKNQAVMGGIVTDSSIRDYIGQRILLTVEDNGDNSRVPDKVTWGVYQKTEIGWTPSDAERKEDEGVGLRWWATDYERKDDVGYEMPRDPKATTNTQTFPATAYSFIDFPYTAGDILVRS